MKTILIAAAALTLGGAAIAQNTTGSGQTQGQSGSGTMQSDQNMNSSTQGSMSQGNMSQGTGSQGTMSQGNMSQGNMSQGNMQQPIGQPMGQSTNSGNMSNMGAMNSGMSTANYPRCSRTVTDRCMQGPARGARRR